MHSWMWTLCVLLTGLCASQAQSGPQYMVPIPAVLEAGAETTICASLMDPNETLTMTATLISAEENVTLFTHKSDIDFHICRQFTVPQKQEEMQNFKVEVQGETFHSEQVRKVLVRAYKPFTFIQTDRPLYLPGQKVNFRLVSLDSRLRAAPRLYDVIQIKDPYNNTIKQWLNETSAKIILQLSYSLDPEDQEGQYQIFVKAGEDKISQSFEVEKYVLPRFDFTLEVKDEVSVAEEELHSKACAIYTFGRPVPGTVKMTVCRPLDPAIEPWKFNLSTPCQTETKQTDTNGCATFSFPKLTFSELYKEAVKDVLHVSAIMEEEGAGISRRQDKKITISFVIGELSIIDTPPVYKSGENVEGKVLAVDYNGKPIPNLPVYLFEGKGKSATKLQDLTTNDEGLAAFSISTDNFSGDVVLQASDKPTPDFPKPRVPHYETKDYSLKMFRPIDDDTRPLSSLKVQQREEILSCGGKEEIQIAYTVAGEPQGLVDLMYLVLARGAILSQGFKQVEVQDGVNQATESFELQVTPDMAPEIQLVAYAVLPSGTVIAHSADFNVENCFSHKVFVNFAPTAGVPGEEINMQVTAQPGSVCGVSAVDQSVLVKEPGKTLEPETIFDLLPVNSSRPVPKNVVDPSECLVVRPKRQIKPDLQDSPDDAYSVFTAVGLKMATNLFIQLPSCLKYRGRNYLEENTRYVLRDPVAKKVELEPVQLPTLILASAVPDERVDDTFDIAFSVIVRTYFPQTWFWDLLDVGDSGRKDVSLTVPDTITTWETEAFCLSPLGFGMAPRQKFNVFRPFLLGLQTPYSVIQGETFELKATVFNYLPSCMMIAVRVVVQGEDFGPAHFFCLCENEQRTVSWNISAPTVEVLNVSAQAMAVESEILCNNQPVSVPERGHIHVVKKSVIVQAEGNEVTNTYNWLLCPNGSVLEEEILIDLPPDVIDGSAHASVSVLGDIMGRSLKNLNRLLRLPRGTGEANIAIMATDTNLLEYLSSIGQLTPEILEKGTGYLQSGYERQLRFQHRHGGFTTFGMGDQNTWLTAFVTRSLFKAQNFIYIDPLVLFRSTTWLQRQQLNSGCFEMSGNLFVNKIKGGVSDKVTLTAYVTAAFLELGYSPQGRVVQRALWCLKTSTKNLKNTYTTALMAYVFTLAKDLYIRDLLLQHLDTVAIREGGFLHWSQKGSETSVPLSVEISSYVLLAKLGASPTAEDLGYASGIVRWLTRQQNAFGGFSSTQDTVVALQALALYSTLVYSPEGSSTVTLQAPSETLEFEVNPDNRLVYQEKALQDTQGNFKLEVNGSACASVQIVSDYNIPAFTPGPTLSVKIRVEVDTSNPNRVKLTLHLELIYIGKESISNLLILDIKVLSGFVLDEQSLKRLRASLLVDRVDLSEDHILVYLQEIPRDTSILYSVDLVQEISVINLKSAAIKIYDFYEPDDHTVVNYILPQLTDDNLS
ncbi:unnamed protein product [Ophioblennius macclurei]